MHTINGIDELPSLVGTELGASDWQVITQQQIDTFAEVTGDHQWIHTDPARAAMGPFGTTIAHGYLILSLIPTILERTVQVEGIRMAVNYGSNKVRYIAPVPVGSRVRGVVRLDEVETTATGTRVIFTITIELEHAQKPACVAETISLLA
ncbi:MaoC family dehydratase [Nocardia sp. bgisy134]|uniref:MaoC family dehydratase n=1 Tax=Nocardia sp. bgisy134 TaxID=3413789 RepID=UPI003D70E3A9